MIRSLRRALIAVSLIAALTIAGPAFFGAISAAPATIVTFAHMNDVYEIDPIEGGSFGGLARVATLFDRLRRAGPLVTTLGGDFLSPSAIGTARVDGEPLLGRQMVDVLNQIGLDWATLGNHEFDIPESAFRARMTEAKFKVIVSNVTDASGAPFPGTVDMAIAPIKTSGRVVRVGVIGLVIDYNRKPWVRYLPPVETARAKVAALGGKVDVIVALTHQALADDENLIDQIPEIDLVLGGHEHQNWYLRRGRSFAPIVKADANARSVAIVSMRIPSKGRPNISVRFDLVNSSLPMQPHAQTLIKRWMDSGLAALRTDGFAPEAVVADVPIALDGRDAAVRHRPGDLTTLVAGALKRETGADIGLLNGGTIRIDDVLPPGPIRQYDVFRLLPFGGTVVRATMDGATLKRILEIGLQNQGIGGYLHPVGVVMQDGGWVVNGRPLDPSAKYSVGMPEFLLTGGETRLDFLNRDNPNISDVRVYRDIRAAVMDEIRARYGKVSGVFDDRLQREPGLPRH
jgi:5'-nucleotidase/UDP-sugar diphosphatase